MRKKIKDRWNKESPNTPGAECATLLLLRNHKQRRFQDNHEYSITRSQNTNDWKLRQKE
jgi:hypothetical protein